MEKPLKNPYVVRFVSGQYKTQAMCEKAVEKNPWALKIIPDHLKTKKMCYEAFQEDTSFLMYIPNWFVRSQQVNLW